MAVTNTIRNLWIILCVGLACLGLAVDGSTSEVAYYGIILFTFPLGLIGLVFLPLMPMVYLSSIALGFVQWFIFFPKLLLMLKKIRSRAMLSVTIFLMVTCLALLVEFLAK